MVVLGLIGCGVISDSYLTGAARSALVRMKSVADLRPEAAAAQAAKYNVAAVSIDALLADPEIDIVINLTVPMAHADVDHRILASGKHVYSEKPLAATFIEGKAVLADAAIRGLRVGCAPDTFMGAGHQACRHAIDSGRIGRLVNGIATVMSHGMEHWHPNPDFFFQPGGGPILDLGVYYVTDLVQLLGPVKTVTAIASRGSETRTISSEPRAGEIIPVTVNTTVNGVLGFASGAQIVLSTSWDVWKHRRLPFELYGSEGSLLVPDPNFFGGEPMITTRDGDFEPLDIAAYPFGAPNRILRDGRQVADYRIIGLLDMACAIKVGRPHRASGEIALHVLEVLEAFDLSSAEGRHIAMTTTCVQPAAVPLGGGEEVFVA